MAFIAKERLKVAETGWVKKPKSNIPAQFDKQEFIELNIPQNYKFKKIKALTANRCEGFYWWTWWDSNP